MKCYHLQDVLSGLFILAGKGSGELIYSNAGHSTTVRQIGAKTVQAKIAEVYDYTDELGELLYQNCRYEPKTFRQRRPDGSGWIWNLDGTRRVLYRLQELLRADPKDWVFYVEGEADCDRLVEHGLTATTAGAVYSWKNEFAEFFNNRKVCILPDNDPAGKGLAVRITKALRDVNCPDVRVLNLPGLGESEDVSVWLNNGGTKEKLLALIDKIEPEQNPANGEFNLTDAGNAERFAALHGDRMRYCWSRGKWLFYDGTRWNIESGLEIANRLAVDTARSIIQESERLEYKQRGEFLKWSHLSESNSRLSAMLTLAKSVPPIPAYAKDFDTDLWLLNCENGVVDLRTGELQPHNPDLMLTKLAPVVYDPKAKLKLWDDFLVTVTDGNIDKMNFLQLAAGYSATGDCSEERLFLIHGPTATGKSSFLEPIKTCMGDYAQTANFETFLQRKQVGGARNDIARLTGSRIVVSIEVEQGKKLAEGLIKMLTGGDTITARFLYREDFEFIPQFTLWLAANEAPRIRDDDSAMWRRILRIPFDHSIPKEEQDQQIKATLKNPNVAGPAILAWIVAGCLKWQKQRLIVPGIIEESTKAYRESQDPLKEFFEDSCDFDPAAFVPVSDLREAYDQYAKDNGIRYTLSQREFNKRITGKNCKKKPKRYTNSVGTEKVGKCWTGITLKCNHLKDEKEQFEEAIPF